MIRRAPGLLAAGLAAVVAAGATARAEPDTQRIRDPDHRFELRLPEGWRPVETGSASIVAAFAREPSGAALAITRADYPNLGAWRWRDRFFDRVETGVRRESDDYRLLSRRRHRLEHRVPAMDLAFRRTGSRGPETVAIRFLFYRRYTLAIALAVPGEADRRLQNRAGAIRDSFVPYFGE